MRVPAEWEPQSSIYLCWPSNEKHWGDRLDGIRAFVEALVARVLDRQDVHLVCQKGEALPEAALSLWRQKIHRLELVTMDHNDIWIRDYGPFWLWNDRGERMVRQFKFNAWGEKFPPWDLDGSFAERLAQTLGDPFEASNLVLEGGAMEFNGEGVAITTKPCLKGLRRNESLSLAEVETGIKNHLGLDELVVLEDGLKGDHTDGHIDNMVRFIGPRRVVMPRVEVGDVNAELLSKVASTLKGWRHPQEGWALELHFLPSLAPQSFGEEWLPRSYLNFIFLNGALLYPTYGAPTDAEAGEILKELVDREVISLDCRLLIEEGGALHCMTRQCPQMV